MKWYNNSRILKKYFALAAIYLIISLTFFTARALAVLNYDISGDNDVSGFARADSDIIKINVEADSNVSFDVGQNTANYQEIPLDGCVANNSTGLINCLYYFQPTDINTNVQSVPFVLKQDSGDPPSIAGSLSIDSVAPQVSSFVANKNGDGINFTYSLADYLASASENPLTNCIGSGIGYIEIDVQGKPVFTQDITTHNCTISGNYFANFSNTYSESIIYGIVVRDRAGNEYRSTPAELSGDFRAPEIDNTFKIMQGNNELTSFSSMAQVQADVVVTMEDSSLNLSNVHGDLSGLNLNKAINIPYKNWPAECILESENSYQCTFHNIELKPGSAEFGITITATDSDGNTATKTINKTIELTDNAGQLLYIGPSKNHCTTDLSQCFLKSGKQLLQAELDTTSNYDNRVVYLGVDSDKIFATCKLSDVWMCTSGFYNIPTGTSSIDVFMAESYDNYGNMINSNLDRKIMIDDIPPSLVEINSTNSNNNNNCSIAGDTLTFSIIAKEASPELKVYLNTSAFTTDDTQTGQCTLVDDNWDCTLVVKDFISTPTSVTQNIILEDLAGNTFPITEKFDVCKSVSASVPNVIFKVQLDGEAPTIDRRTASKISVKTYIPIKIDVQKGATLMYLSIDNCVASGMDGLNVMGTGHYFMPSYGDKSTLVLYIGHNNAQLTENSMDINCTMTARVKIGPTVYLQEERKDFTINVGTYNNPLGTIDDATNTDVNAVKENLVSLDKKIDSWAWVEKSVGSICSIAESMGKINTVLQAVKAAIYGVLIATNAIAPEAYGGLENIWKVVNGALGTIHGIVTQYVWPPGILPGKGALSGKTSIAVGSVVKWFCMLYTCKDYDVGTYAQLIGDLGARLFPAEQPTTAGYGQASGDDKQTYVDSDGKTVTGVYRDADGNMVTKDGQYLTETKVGDTTKLVPAVREIDPTTGQPKIDSNGKPVLVPAGSDGKKLDYSTGKPVPALVNNKPVPVNTKESVGTYVTYGKQSDFAYQSNVPTQVGITETKTYTDISGIAHVETSTSVGVYQTVSMPVTFSQNSVAAERDMLINALNGHSWIIDPYKSVHYDGLCIPAYIYNLKKERQLECMYLRCLEAQDGPVVPKVMCDGNYKVNKCLYLDSAEYVLGGSNVWTSFKKGLVPAFENTASSMALSYAYRRLCSAYYSMPKTLKEVKTGDFLINGWKAAACGTAGSLISIREIIDTFKNPFVSGPLFGTGKAAGEVDYCQGLDYKDEYTAPGADRWFTG